MNYVSAITRSVFPAGEASVRTQPQREGWRAIAAALQDLPTLGSVGTLTQLASVLAVNDYAGAWTAERGRCHRLVVRHEVARLSNYVGGRAI